MSLPPLPDKVVLHCQPPDHYWYGNVYGFTTLQMQWYGQKCYEQGRYDRSMELLKTYNKATINFEPYDPRDDLK